MFRTKKKSASGRKRKETAQDSDEEQPVVEEDAVGVALKDERVARTEVEETEEFQLEQIRRNRKLQRGKAINTTIFSSRTTVKKTKVSINNGSDGATIESSSIGRLSFADDEGSTTKVSKQERKVRIRPNIVSAGVGDAEMDDEPQSQYSTEMLESLKRAQNVLPRSQGIEKDDNGNEWAENDERLPGPIPDTVMDIDMDDVSQVKQKETEVNVDEEEFIPLHSKMMQDRRRKNRVTFGVHDHGPRIPKMAEVVEEALSESDEDDDAQHRRWEEELMRRGGHHGQLNARGSHSTDKSLVYPTRKKVPCASLEDMLTKLQKSVDAATFEHDRSQRELVQIEAESILVEEKLKQQREELLVSSEKFEYFQVVEDFVKGLSFCLREKLPVIEAKEKEIAEQQARMATSRFTVEQQEIQEEIRARLAEGHIKSTDFTGLNVEVPKINGNSETQSHLEPQPNNTRLAKFRRKYQDSFVVMESEENLDLFADAIDDMNSLGHVYGRFQEWQSKFPDIYKSSYCELALEKLYEPYIRAELLYWDPLGVAHSSQTVRGNTWGFADFEWFRILRQHISEQNGDNERSDDKLDGPTLYQIKVVVLEKLATAISSYFDPYSAIHTQSIVIVIEEMVRYGFIVHCEAVIQRLISDILARFAAEPKNLPLLALDTATAGSNENLNAFALYLLGRFCVLQDNLLTLFVALPKGALQDSGFRCLMQLFHHLLAYLRHCQQLEKTCLTHVATQVVSQLTGSSFLLQVLSSPAQEKEFKHLMELLAPYLTS